MRKKLNHKYSLIIFLKYYFRYQYQILRNKKIISNSQYLE
ncbi:hypothetical protein pb186bvf_021008 [Paramecium bursaria]